jgi:hypothetical protein
MGISIEETQKGKRKNRDPSEKEKLSKWREDFENLKEQIRREQDGDQRD